MEHLQGSGTAIVDLRPFRARWHKCLLDSNPRAKSYTFYTFLKDQGWKIQADGVLIEERFEGGLPNPGLEVVERRTKFVQHWLFFELLREVFRDDPIFRYHDFIESGEWINTSALQNYLKRWEEREHGTPMNETRIERMVRTQQALETARDYVSQYLAVRTNSSVGPIWTVDQAVALSIIVLGEALSRALIKIQQDSSVRFSLKGWHNHDSSSQGWGYSNLVLDKFNTQSWCPKTKRMLQRLMKGNTIGLLLALSYPLDTGPHIGCTVDDCLAQKVRARFDLFSAMEEPLSSTERGKFKDDFYEALLTPVLQTKPRHGVECTRVQDFSQCKLIGPDEDKLIRILRDKQIPLFYYDDRDREVHVERMQSFKPNHYKPYTVFSHVWIDGFGNHKENKMFHCTLKFLSDICEKIPRNRRGSGEAMESHRRYFWIDTLALPAKKIHAKHRNDAVGQIHEIYWHASDTVVLDGGLMEYDLKSYAGAAMTITMSRWMTRLWTLQEAVLSKNILLNFNDDVYPLDQIEARMGEEDSSYHKSVSEAVRIYYNGILGEERKKFRKSRDEALARDEILGRRGPELVASVWRAVQWRGASFRHHETLALAILLSGPVERFAALSSAVEPEPGKQEQFMKELIQHLADQKPCAIPSGMIFLPGEKLPQQGFRWAPRTWLTAQEISSPDPLAFNDRVDDIFLSPNGLSVIYTGFRLHCIGNQIESLVSLPHFHFPIHFELHDWYLVSRPSDDEPFPGKTEIGENCDLAIIAMQYPVSQKGQIALLVAIKKQSARYLEVNRLSRVILSRESRHHTVQDCKSKFRDYETPMLCGEVLENQHWLVDGPEPQRTSLPKAGQPPSDQRDAPIANNVISAKYEPKQGLARRFTERTGKEIGKLFGFNRSQTSG